MNLQDYPKKLHLGQMMLNYENEGNYLIKLLKKKIFFYFFNNLKFKKEKNYY